MVVGVVDKFNRISNFLLGYKWLQVHAVLIMEAEQFSLCWNNFHQNLRTGFHSLLQEEDLVDVTLAVEGQFLKAHKTVLSVCSPYFKELFKANPCKHPIVILQDVKYSSLCSLLEFMYQGEVSVSQDEIPVFMKVAEMLKVKGLTENNSSGNTSVSNYILVSKISCHDQVDKVDDLKKFMHILKIKVNSNKLCSVFGLIIVAHLHLCLIISVRT